jgi:hypothetical protein
MPIRQTLVNRQLARLASVSPSDAITGAAGVEPAIFLALRGPLRLRFNGNQAVANGSISCPHYTTGIFHARREAC